MESDARLPRKQGPRVFRCAQMSRRSPQTWRQALYLALPSCIHLRPCPGGAYSVRPEETASRGVCDGYLGFCLANCVSTARGAGAGGYQTPAFKNTIPSNYPYPDTYTDTSTGTLSALGNHPARKRLMPAARDRRAESTPGPLAPHLSNCTYRARPVQILRTIRTRFDT
jgi:hypothetical protein